MSSHSFKRSGIIASIAITSFIKPSKGFYDFPGRMPVSQMASQVPNEFASERTRSRAHVLIGPSSVLLASGRNKYDRNPPIQTNMIEHKNESQLASFSIMLAANTGLFLPTCQHKEQMHQGVRKVAWSGVLLLGAFVKVTEGSEFDSFPIQQLLQKRICSATRLLLVPCGSPIQ